MARYSNTNNGYAPTPSTCPACGDPEPQIRTCHQLALTRAGGLDALRAHLTEYWVKMRDGEKQRPDLVDDICRWVAGVVEQFSGFPDDATGRTMAWWDARDMMMQAQEQLAKEAYAKAPEKWRAEVEGHSVAGFSRARVTPRGKVVPDEVGKSTSIRMLDPDEAYEYMREPGEDDED